MIGKALSRVSIDNVSQIKDYGNRDMAKVIDRFARFGENMNESKMVV